ncbi:MAG: TIGR02281 family clan AA aspartic protease [Pseudomonadota bacterium]
MRRRADPAPSRRQRHPLRLAAALVATFAGTVAASAQDLPTVAIDNEGPQIVKLVALLAILVVVLISMRSIRFPQMIRTAGIWVLVLLGLITLYTYRGPLESMGREVAAVLVPGMAVSDGERVMVRRGFEGHFVLQGRVDGEAVDFLFDTGASMVVLSARDASAAGFNPATLSYSIPVTTASGMTMVAPVRINQLSIGDITVNSVRAAVARPDDLEQSLLGMTFLDRLSGYEVRRDRLVLHP